MCAVYQHRIAVNARLGLTLMELAVAIAVFSALLATSMKMIMVASNQTRANDQRQIALLAAQSITEQIENIPWDHLPSETASQMPLPDSAIAHLPGAELKVSVNDETDPVAKRIAVEVTWKGRGDARAGPVRLTTWVFPEDLPSEP